jgi:uncharacterized damage-inducible protein DinB
MKTNAIDSFLSVYKRTREITNRVIAVIPPDKMDWSYMPGKFTIGDLIRHIAAIERTVFVEVLLGNPPSYKGCGKELADGFDNILHYFNQTHEQSIKIIESLRDMDTTKKIKSLDGKEVELDSFLRALITHEIHHRAALCIYLNLLGKRTPPILGFSEEQVIQASNSGQLNSINTF